MITEKHDPIKMRLILNGKEVPVTAGSATSGGGTGESNNEEKVENFNFTAFKALDAKAMANDKYIGRLAYTFKTMLDLLLKHDIPQDLYPLYLKALQETLNLLQQKGVFLPEEIALQLNLNLTKKYPPFGGCQQAKPCV
jgi:hypothetical protein